MNAHLRTGLIVAGVGVIVYFAWKAWRSSTPSSASSLSVAASSGRASYQVPGGRRLDPGTIGDVNPPVDVINDAHLDPGLLLTCDTCGPEVPPMIDTMFYERPTGELTGGEDAGTNVANAGLGPFMQKPLAFQSV